MQEEGGGVAVGIAPAAFSEEVFRDQRVGLRVENEGLIVQGLVAGIRCQKIAPDGTLQAGFSGCTIEVFRIYFRRNRGEEEVVPEGLVEKVRVVEMGPIGIPSCTVNGVGGNPRGREGVSNSVEGEIVVDMEVGGLELADAG